MYSVRLQMCSDFCVSYITQKSVDTFFCSLALFICTGDDFLCKYNVRTVRTYVYTYYIHVRIHLHVRMCTCTLLYVHVHTYALYRSADLYI